MVAPKLRFQEFDGDWESKKLKDLTDILKCGVASTPKYVTEGGYPFLSAQNISRNGEMNYSKVNNISDDFYKKISKTKLLKGDILYSRVGASYGVAAIFDREEEYGVYVSLTHIRVNDTLNNIFLKQFLNSPKARIQAEQGVFQGGGVQNLNVGVVEEFNLTLPSKQEQTKIASFLSAVDEKISQLTQKHQLLSQYKQGMMQKLFSQQIRFKADDGCEFGDWRKVKFSESFVFHNTNSYSRALLAEVGEVMNIHYGDIHTKFSMLFDVSKEIVPFLNDQIDSTKIAENQFLKEGDLVIADASEDYKDIGKAIEVVHLNNQKVVAGLHTYIARPVQPFALGFCGYLMQTFEVREQIKKLATGISVLGISKTNIGKVEIKLPCLEEQTKIANFLSSIDQKIDVVSEQLEQAKLWKKGLLQQMFV